MKNLERFGNLLNEQDNPIVIKDFEQEAHSLGRNYYRDGFQVYTYNGYIAVAKISHSKITRFTLIEEEENYRLLYSGGRDRHELLLQALYQGACILTRRAGKTIGLDYNI